MNNQNCEDQQQSLEFLDCYYSFQLPDGSSLNSPCLKPLNMKFGCKGSSSAATHGALQPISSPFGSQVSPFYAAEHYMGIPQYDCQVSTLPLFSQLSKNYTPDFPSYQLCEEHFSVDSVREDGSDLQSRDMLQSVVKFGLHGNQDQPIQFQQDYPGRQFLDLQEKAVVENPVLKRSQSIVPYKGNQDSRVSYDAFKRHLYPEKQILEMSSGVDKHVSSGPVTISSKTRIRWTQDLHEQFVECVNRLGGAEKATPKGILNLMDSDGLTIFHVKSHLQKYRNAKYTPEPAEGKSDKRNSLNDLRKLDPKTGVQIAEALQLQLEVQKRLHEQLEIQRNLQIRIEEQGKQLKKMFDQQQQSSKSLVDTDNLDSPVEAQVSSLGEGSGNTHFPSKIS